MRDLIIILCCLVFFAGGIDANWLTFHICHDNIFHLFVNCLALYLIAYRIDYLKSYVFASVSYLLPCPDIQGFLYGITGDTVGLSAFIFASSGLVWGRYLAFNHISRHNAKKLTFLSLILVGSVFIPHIDGMIHIYSFLISLLYSYAESRTGNRSTR